MECPNGCGNTVHARPEPGNFTACSNCGLVIYRRYVPHGTKPETAYRRA